MTRYLCALGYVGALALVAALTLSVAEPGGSVAIVLTPEDCERVLPGSEEENTGPAAIAGERRQPSPQVLAAPSEPRGGLVIEMPPRWSVPRTGVGAFRPYPECEAVGMPFAGVKMCGAGLVVAAQ